MCINQEIVLTRVLAKQVELYSPSVLVGICTLSTRILYLLSKSNSTRIHIVYVHLSKVATHPFAL